MADFSWITKEFIAEQKRDLPISLKAADAAGKTAIVTGANIGIGKETAQHLVRLGFARVIIAVRNLKSGEDARRQIETTTGKKGVVSVMELDLSKWDSVLSFARRANDELDRIDYLVENAAIALDSWSWAEDHETSIKVNALTTLLLGILLMPKLIETGKRFGTQPHLVMIGSGAGFQAKAEMDKVLAKGNILKALDEQGLTNMDLRYPLSKLIHMLLVFRFADLYPVSRTGVVVPLSNPGLVKTTLSRHGKLVTRVFMKGLNALFARSPEMASRTTIHAMVVGEEGHGKYVDNLKVKHEQVPDWIDGPEGKKLQAQLWDEAVREFEKVAPGCLEKIA